MTERESLINQIKLLSNDLDKLYIDKVSFRNHCYLRIAYDNTCGNKWDLIVEKPFIKNATLLQLTTSLDYLIKYKNNFVTVMSDNDLSLQYRKKL